MGKGVKKKKKAGPGRPPVPRSKRDKAYPRSGTPHARNPSRESQTRGWDFQEGCPTMDDRKFL